MENFTEFLSQIDDINQRERTKEVLTWVAQTFPKLEKRIAWNQPMFTDHGTFIIGFSVSKQHLACSPEMAGITYFADEITKAGLAYTKMLLKFPWNKPVDYELLKKIIEYNITDKTDCDSFWRKPV